MVNKYLLFIVFVFSLTIMFNIHISLAKKLYDVKFINSTVGLTHACSYYEIYSNNIKRDILYFDVTSAKEVKGKLKDIRVEVLVNESYQVRVPDYGTCYQDIQKSENMTYTP